MPGTALVPEDAETRAPALPLTPRGLVGRCACECILTTEKALWQHGPGSGNHFPASAAFSRHREG